MQTKCSDTAENTAHSLLQTIKKELRAGMNGVASAAMRQSEDYRVNFGIELPRLSYIASEFGKNHELAQLLWKESVRECKILATIIQPVETMCSDLADIWAEDIHTSEIAQITSLNLFQHIQDAPIKSLKWVASDNEMLQLCGLCTAYHLFKRSQFDDRQIAELKDQADSLTGNDNIAIRRVARNIIDITNNR